MPGISDAMGQLRSLTDGPPRYDDRQVAPEQLEDICLGYLGNLAMGDQVELVIPSTEKQREYVRLITIVAVGRTYWMGEAPGEEEDITEATVSEWPEADYVTYSTIDDEGRRIYDRIRYERLGLAPVTERNKPVGWPSQLGWYLRWPDQTANSPQALME